MTHTSEATAAERALTAAQHAAIERARTELPADERVLGVFLVGSHAAGTADAYSDVDVHCVVADEAAETLGEGGWRDLARTVAGPDTVLLDDLPGMIGGLAITRDWLHVDLIAHPLAEYDPAQYDARRVLFDRDGTLFPEGDRRTERGRTGDPYFPRRAVRLGIYFLGLAPVVLGRGELLAAQAGLTAVRDQVIAVMLAERGVHRTGGAKHLNALLSAEQRAALAAVPPAGPDREQIIAANRVLARELLRRGEALAARTGEEWPAEFAAATVEHVRRHLGVDLSA